MVNIDVQRSLGTIVKYLLYFNLIYFGVIIFIKFNSDVYSFALVGSLVLVNFCFLGMYKIFVKYEYMIASVIGLNKIARNVDKFAGKINGQVFE